MDHRLKKELRLLKKGKNISRGEYYKQRDQHLKKPIRKSQGPRALKLFKMETACKGMARPNASSDKKEEEEPSLETYDVVEVYNIIYGYHLKFTLVPDEEADIFKYKVSEDSGFGQAILGRARDDLVELNPAKNLIFKISKIEKPGP